LYLLGADSEECRDDTPLEGVFEFELGSEVRLVSIMGGFGLLEGLECLDMVEGDREEGKDEREVRRLAPMLPLELALFATVSVVPDVLLVVGRCCIFLIATFVSFVWK
jgi:hypothetical protein